MELVFIHGWGFDRSVWHRVADHFTDVNCHYVELGYTGKPPHFDVPPDAVMIGHSLGAMWALRHANKSIRGLVSIAGFDCFHAHVPAKDIRAMQRNLRDDPEKQMRAFYAACGYIPFYNVSTMNLMRLDEGLQFLLDWDGQMVRDYLACPVMALGAEDDLIVPPAMTRAVWHKHDLRMTQKGGHILPMTRHEWCAENIRAFINVL